MTDNGDGTYTATFTAGLLGGSNTITATINGQVVTSTPPTVTVTPDLFSLSLSRILVMPASILAGGTATITLTVIDTSGNQETAGGLSVRSVPGYGSGSGTFSARWPSSVNGIYTAVFTATTAGSNTITAAINNQAVTSTQP